MSLHSILLKGLLEHFVVFCKLVVVLGRPLNLSNVEGSREDRIHNLAVHSTSGALFDLRNVQTEELVDPANEDALAYEEGSFHHANIIA